MIDGEPLKAFVVSVDYGDILAITLPRNAPHFGAIVVVTTAGDDATHRVVASVQETCPSVVLHVTDAFYRRGAAFNKGAAIEEAFDVLGPAGWWLSLDADIVLPPAGMACDVPLVPGFLYGARRRMLKDIGQWREGFDWSLAPVKPEDEFPGFFQLWHSSDSALGGRPWYPTNWTMANCDSEFQSKWPRERRVRLPLEVLHLGEDGKNWAGRSTAYVDGSLPHESQERAERLEWYLGQRNHNRGGGDPYAAEKLP